MFIPPHMLGALVHPYVQDVFRLQVVGLRQLLFDSTRQPLELSTEVLLSLQELCQESINSCDAGTWEDRVNLNGFNCVFRAGKRGRRA